MSKKFIARLGAAVLLAVWNAQTLVGCEGVGVVQTSNPEQKLSDAEVLFSAKDRPLIAERLIREALSISQRQQDASGEANAYRTYGFFFRSPSVAGSWGEFYRKNGFLERSVTWDTRLEGSVGFFQKAADLYDQLKLYDASTNVYLNMGHTYSLMHDTQHACSAYAVSLDRYHANLSAHPNAKPQTAPGFGSFAEYVSKVRQQDGCMKIVDTHA